jgi:hypothetical protein
MPRENERESKKMSEKRAPNPPHALVTAQKVDPQGIDEKERTNENNGDLFSPEDLAAFSVRVEELMLSGFDSIADIARLLGITHEQATYLKGYIRHLWIVSSGNQDMAVMRHELLQKAKLVEKKAAASYSEFKDDAKARGEFLKIQMSAQMNQARLLGINTEGSGGKIKKDDDDFEKFIEDLRKKKGIKDE